jgi:hypothetical protein
LKTSAWKLPSVRHDPAGPVQHPGGAGRVYHRSGSENRTILFTPDDREKFRRNQTDHLALQKSDAESVATPANWRPGDDVILPTAGSCGTAKERMEFPKEDTYCLDWFMCFKKEKK